MPMKKGFKHSAETRAKISAAHKGKSRTAEHKARISAAISGTTKEKKYSKSCVCGQMFLSAYPSAKYCSNECKRAQHGHGIRHLPEFKCFPQYCAICTRPDDLVGDHDHKTGKARGILCRNCNIALGNMRDNPSRLRSAADYLERTL